MLYQALQPCRFDREYLTGELISGRVILIDVADKLIAWGLIRPINRREEEQEIQQVIARLKQWDKEQLRGELERITGRAIKGQWSKSRLLEQILKAQVGEDYDQNISI